MKRNILILILSFSLFIGCDKDEFAEQNTDPSVVPSPELKYSVTKAIEQIYNDDYTIWFYNNLKYIFPWTQLTTSGTGNSDNVVKMGSSGKQNIYKQLFPNSRDIRARIDNMPKDVREEWRAIRAITFPAQIQPAMTVTDIHGSIIYTEAAMAGYTSPPLLTPKYDSQEKLFTIWLEELDAAIEDLTATNQLDLGNQDLIYGGDYQKWAKFCNLLKLKIAERLLNVDKAKALKIAEEVAKSKAGYMDDLYDDFLYNRGIKYYGPGKDNGTQPGAGAKNIIEFLIKNKDPRVRFIYTKNHFNGEVVQAFLDAGKDLPPYIKEYVNIDNKKFTGWKAPGEPWVRYFGVPIAPKATLETQNEIYFNQSILNKITLNNVEKTYRSTSKYSEFITKTNLNLTYPTKPGGRVIEQKDNYPGIQVLLGSSAETNLLLAEFKLLGANLPKSAQDYFKQGVKLSVERFNLIAKNNKQPYYEKDPVYTNLEEAAAASTKLKDGEIEALLKMPAYDLGTDALEKVRIQQYINLSISPNGDIWTLVRRTGIPKKQSKYLAAEPFLSSGGEELIIPRRFVINTPTEDNKNYQNQVNAYKEQGFTTGTNDPTTLNTERIWFDKKSPNYGEGE